MKWLKEKLIKEQEKQDRELEEAEQGCNSDETSVSAWSFKELWSMNYMSEFIPPWG